MVTGLKAGFGRVAAAIGRRLNQSDVREVCALVAIIYLAAMTVAFVSASQNHRQTVFGEPLGADFAAFYDAGTLINRYGVGKLYDLSLQAEIYHEGFPLVDRNTDIFFLNAPFLALPLPILARLAYPWAYALWAIASLALYAGGFRLLWRELKGMPEALFPTALLVAVTFMPFMVECLAGGQTTAVGFLSLASAVLLEGRGKLFASGLALSLLTYKPTLLVLIGPMLVVTGRWRVIAGLAVGGTALGLVSVGFGGWGILSRWFDALVFAGRHATSATSGLRLWKFVDLNSFARGLADTHVALRWIIAGTTSSVALVWLLRGWWCMRTRGELNARANWALTLAWLPILNVYVGFYDTALLALSVMLVTEQLYRRSTGLPLTYRLMLLALYVAPWCSQPIARSTGFQLYTLVIAAWGVFVLRDVGQQLAAKSIRPTLALSPVVVPTENR